ncbi:MAG TPA: M23 family peptidase [Methanoculleus sp.]|nr:M23 family peptidase [Methanoculleus sp.]
MPAWPLPECRERTIPAPGDAGSFWEDRGDRRHCGIDLYAPEGSRVAAIVAGSLLRTGVQTSPQRVAYWNRTFYVLVKGNDGLIIRYAELGKLHAVGGDCIGEGQCIGRVGAVIDPQRIDGSAPAYIRRLGARGACSMLHLEVYAALPKNPDCHPGGNWFGREKPPYLIDPAEILRKAGGK